MALDLFGQQLPAEAQREGAGDACECSGLGVVRVAPGAGGVAPGVGGVAPVAGGTQTSHTTSPNKRFIFLVMAGIASDSRFPPVQDLLRSATRLGLLLCCLFSGY